MKLLRRLVFSVDREGRWFRFGIRMLVEVWLCLSFFSVSFSAASAEERRLFKQLFEDSYVPDVRPRLNPNDVISITIDLEVNQIKELNEQSQTLYTVGFFQAEWTDDYLQWEPENYSGIREFTVPPNRLWLPDFGIQNSAETFYQDDFFDHFRAHVNHTGRITWAFGGVFETSCEINTLLFPFDTQSCPLVVENWAYTNRSVSLVNGSSGVKLDTYHTNGIWELIGHEVELGGISYGMHPDESYSQIRFLLHLQRKPRYYLINILIPCVFLTSIALLVFWLPPEAGEKVSLGVTVLLAFSVFQLVIANSTPENSDSTPILSIFVTLTMSLSTVSVVTTVLVLHLHHRESYHRVPPWLRTLTIAVLAKLMCMTLAKRKRKKAERKENALSNPSLGLHSEVRQTLFEDPVEMKTLENTTASGIIPPVIRELSKLLEEVKTELKLLTSRFQTRDEEKEVLEEWQAVAKVLDRFLFWIVLSALIAAIIWLIAMSLQNNSNFVN